MDTSAFVAEIKKIPPVTRFLAGSSLAVTLPVMLQVVSPYSIVYTWSLVYGRLEVWRIWTSFFYGGSGIQYLFDFVMLYRTSDAIETQHYASRSADYAWQLLLSAAGILALNQPLGSLLHYWAFLLSLMYTSSRLNPNMPFSLFGVVTVPAAWWPYVMLGLDGVMGGSKAFAQSLTGIIVGHAWWLLVWRDTASRQPAWTKAPEWLKNLISSPRLPPGASGPQPSGFGGARESTTPSGQSPNTYQWGAGQRLGSQ